MTERYRLILLWTARLGLVAVSVGLGIHAERTLLRDAPALHADEAGHALPAARIAVALGHGDLRGVAAATLRERVWPFLHPWLVTLFFLLFGISAYVARLSTLLCFAAVLCLLPPFARAVFPADSEAPGAAPPLVGWLSAAALVACAPWDLVTTVMGEPLGMLLTLAVLWAAARAAASDRLDAHALCGGLAAAAFFTKYGYGVPLIVALLLAAAWRARVGGIRPLVAALLGALVPIGLWAGAVLSGDLGRLDEIVSVLVNRDEGLRGLPYAAFYGRALFVYLGWPLGVAALLGALAAFWKRTAARLPALLFLGTALLLLTLHPNKQQRYLLPLLPVMLVLAEVEAARRLRRREWLLVLWPAAAALVLLLRSPLARLDETVAAEASLRGSRAIVDYLADHVPPRRPVLLLGSTGLIPHLALSFELLARDRSVPEVDLLPFPGDRGWDPRYRAGYPSESRPEYAQVLERALASGRYAGVATLALGAASPFRPPWLAKWDAWGQNYVRAMDDRAAEAHYVLRSERAFADDDARVRVFVPETR